MYCFLFASLLFFVFLQPCNGKSIEERLENLKQSVGEFKSSSVHKVERILHLEKTVQELQTSLVQKDATILNLEKDLSKANTRIVSIEKILDDSSRQKEVRASSSKDVENDPEMVHMNTDVNSVQKHSQLKSQAKRLLMKSVPKYHSNESHVAFHAYQSKGRTYNIHETVVFDVEEIDVGNGYINADGIFVVPVKGVYVFAWTIVTDFNAFFESELIINGVKKRTAFMSSEEITDVHQATGLIVVHVNQGDNVSVRTGSTNVGTLRSNTDNGRTTFSGWILFSQ